MGTAHHRGILLRPRTAELSFLLALLVPCAALQEGLLRVGLSDRLSWRIGRPVGWVGLENSGLGFRLRANRALKLLRYVTLVVALFFTYRTGELVLRGYDPFFLIFSGFGHGSAGILSVVVLAGIFIGMWVVPMFFCRYLCPMGAVFDPLSRIGLLKVTRDSSKCTACGNCSGACLHDIPVQKLQTVRHRDCTNCLECLEACPEKNVLQLRAGL